jgi:alkanesulfonate monooxygenase SsuD/methylene tetrahydromethanopterin reductase-like flavin-dependent oxidoreductase (luciferase family)
VALHLGIALWNQAATWRDVADAARRIDGLGYDHLWTWDHLYGIVGDPYQPTFEGYAELAALAALTNRVQLGLFVGAVTFRNPFVVAKALTTIDHVSGGRAIAGLGGAWFELEHGAAGIDFGTGVGQRLDWLEEAVSALRALFDGRTVTSEPGAHYAFDDLVLLPQPVQARLPIMIGGGGEQKTLRTVARHADMWNDSGSVEYLARKVDVLRQRCDEAGRDPTEIELTVGCKVVIRDSEREAEAVVRSQMAANRTPMSEVEGDPSWWIGPPALIAERMQERVALGFGTFIAEQPAPFDTETIERWIGEVRPLVEG